MTTPAAAGDTDQPALQTEPEPQDPAEPAKQTRHLKAVPAPADQPTPAPEPKPVAKRTRRPKAPTTAADGDAKPSATRKRTAAKPATS
ncbi:hypothetical protein ACWD5Q_34540 [Streptomyces sp. NPDC002513]